MLGAVLATATRGILVVTLCSEFTDEPLWEKVDVVIAGLARNAFVEGPFAEGVGVPIIEGRDLKEGGLIIKPLIPARITLPLTCVLFPRAWSLANGGAISEEIILSFFGTCMVSIPESERTDEDRDSTGIAVEIEGSRRWATLDGWAGVLPAVSLTPIFLFSYMEGKNKTRL